MNMCELRKTGLLSSCRHMCTTKQMFMPDQSALNKLSVSKRICEIKYNDQRRLHSDTVFQHFTTHFRFFPYVRTETVKPWQTEEVTTILRIHIWNKYSEIYSHSKVVRTKPVLNSVCYHIKALLHKLKFHLKVRIILNKLCKIIPVFLIKLLIHNYYLISSVF